MDIIEHISRMVQEGRATEVEDGVRQALRDGIRAREILERGLVAGIAAASLKFRHDEIFVPQILVSTRAVNRGRAILEPYFPECDIKPLGIVVIGTVAGDLHDIGKNVVAMMLRGIGFTVFDIGINVPPERFVAAVQEHNADIVGLSALLTTTLPSLERCVAAIKASGSSAKIIVGGAPVTQRLADRIGADAYCSDANAAMDHAKRFVNARS